MELPYLKSKKNQGGGGPTVELERVPDGSAPDKLLGLAADEIIDSYHRGDSAAFLHAMRAFILMIKDEDRAA